MIDDVRIIRRARPFIDAAINEQNDETAQALTAAIAAGHLAMTYTDGPAGELMIDFFAAGHHFVSVAARNVGVCSCSLGEIHYHPDPILDDDLLEND